VTPIATPTLPEGPLPDLVITDIWSEGRAICYQVHNAGAGVASGSREAGLFVDGVYRLSQHVELDLLPSARGKGCFDYAWACTEREDVVRVEADLGDAVVEEDESNNRREEAWACDVSPPRIVGGPEVIDITTDSALIAWQTDEESDGLVRYGGSARLYSWEVAEGDLRSAHAIALNGLQPSTRYHYIVRSADASGNAAESRDSTFETLPLPDNLDPAISLDGPGSCRGTITIAAAASDNRGVGRVEFRLHDVSAAGAGSLPAAATLSHDLANSFTVSLASLFTDYAAPYEFEVDCATFANGQYSVTAKAVDLSGRFVEDSLAIDVANILDLVGPTVNVYHPYDGATVSGDQRILVLISDDTGISTVEFLANGSTLDSYSYPTCPSSIEFSIGGRWQQVNWNKED